MKYLLLLIKKLFSVIMEKRINGEEIPSIGRITLIVTFSFALHHWITTWEDIPSSMLTFLMACLLYVVGSKVVTAQKDATIEAFKSVSKSQDQSDKP